MTNYMNAPLSEGQDLPVAASPSVALLIDFDNVTMATRSDLSKELKLLLESDVVPGKITVKRAYADWRRYPQYVVPLSEACVELIFAPALKFRRNLVIPSGISPRATIDRSHVVQTER